MGSSKLGAGANIAGLIAGVMGLVVTGCGQSSTPPATSSGPPTASPTLIAESPGLAEVLEVAVSGNPGAYSISVTVKSPDSGCDSYADWWGEVSAAGELLYRRVLLHSHVDEQPFTRSGGPSNIQPNETVIVRAHMSGTGYGGTVMRGTIASGFSAAVVSADFAADLETQAPLPDSCGF